MKKTILLFTLLFSSFAVSASATVTTNFSLQSKAIKKAGNTGFGLGAGTLAVGLSLKHFLADDFSIQANVGYWRGCWNCSHYYYNNNGLAMSLDFLVEGGPLLSIDDKLSIDWEAGLGGGLGINNWADNGGLGVGISGVVGIQFNIHLIPVDFVIEYRPGLYVIPNVGLDIVNFTGHARYYF